MLISIFIFSPARFAFSNTSWLALTPNEQDVLNANSSQLLGNHIVTGIHLLEEFQNIPTNQSLLLQSLAGLPLVVTSVNGFVYINGSVTNFLRSDLFGTNGVIHVVDSTFFTMPNIFAV